MSANTYQIKITAKTAEEFNAIQKKVEFIHHELVKRFERVESGYIGLEFHTSTYMTQDHINFPRNFQIKRVGFRATEGEWGSKPRTLYPIEVYGTFTPEGEGEDVRPFDAIFRFVSVEPKFEVKSF